MALLPANLPVALAPPQPPAVASGAADPPAAAPARDGDGHWQPPAWAPPMPAVQYVKEAVTALLLVLALPYVVYKLLTDPARLLSRAGRKHVDP